MTEPATEYTTEEKEVLGYVEPGGEQPASPAEGEPKEPPPGEKPEPSTGEPEPPKKDETAEPPAPTGEEDKKFTQKDLERILGDRLKTRDTELSQLKSNMQRLQGELAGRRRGEPQDQTRQDLGQLLDDSRWRGWTMQMLQAYDTQHGTDHADKVREALTRRAEFDAFFQRREQQYQRQEMERRETEKFKEFKKTRPEYFTEASDVQRGDFLSTLTEKGRKLLDLMSTQEVYNWDLAHKLLNYEDELTAAKKQAVADYIKENSSTEPLKRAKVTGTSPAESDSLSKMSDEKLVDAYDRSKGGRARELRKELVRRGLLAPTDD